jgi:GNAT superfamily N-acetyltransferase
LSPRAFRIRAARDDELPFLWEMLGEAVAWPDRAATLAEMLADRKRGCYLEAWGRDGDRALVAQDASGRLLGAAWYRLFSSGRRGFGFVAEDVPEVAIAVRDGLRGRGVGTALLVELIEGARRDGFRALSLSCDRRGRPRRLYERLGFRACGKVPGEDLVIMELDLEAR